MFSYYLHSQNIEMYLSLVNEGQISGVKEQLPELISKYPNNPDIMFLKGIMTTDGNKSVEIYKKILTNFPESRYASESAVKIGEYYYSLGLYSQAGKHLSKIPRVYPRYSNIQRVMDLMVSSFIAIGEEDSAKYYANIYKSMFPTLNVDNFKKEAMKLPVLKEHLLNDIVASTIAFVQMQKIYFDLNAFQGYFPTVLFSVGCNQPPILHFYHA